MHSFTLQSSRQILRCTATSSIWNVDSTGRSRENESRCRMPSNASSQYVAEAPYYNRELMMVERLLVHFAYS